MTNVRLLLSVLLSYGQLGMWLIALLINAATWQGTAEAQVQISPGRNAPQVPPSPNAKTNREPIWIESGDSKKADVFFRRTMELPDVEQSHIEFESTEACEVYVNGKKVGTSRQPGTMEKVDLTGTVRAGKNVIAIRSTHRTHPNPSIKVGFFFKPRNGKWRIVVSDSEWKVARSPTQSWQSVRFDDTNWSNAISRTPGGATTNSNNSSVANKDTSKSTPNQSKKDLAPKGEPIRASLADYDSSIEPPPRERFTTKPGFSVVEVFDAKTAGSILAMAFNEFGHIIASQEGGPLLLFYDSDKDGTLDKSRTYCTLIENVQGILPLNGEVFVTGDGKEGSGFYKLTDSDRNGELEKAELILKFKGTPGEHGPHQLTFGPDGGIYIVVGNHSQLDLPWPEDSTYPKPYEGDLVQPRFEDPGGHAEGVKAPGGTIVRYDLTSQKSAIVAGGLRNVYDIAFHPNGSLFAHDSDMEADMGAVWHRTTALFRIVEGGEYGWRSGWANWPDYYLDRLPAITSAGRGSPTGMVVYNHVKFPARYHRTLFLADWSEGRILSCNIEPTDKSKPKIEEFVSGTPMNVTDLEVGPDGWLYFSTGGRGTDGGIYRIQWTGEIPDKVLQMGEGITKAIRIPQLYSSFGRQAAALVRKEMGDDWAEQVAGVAYSNENPARYRMQALDLMQLLGPVPTPEMLIELSNTSSDLVRAKCARLMGLHPETEIAERLVKMLSDNSSIVRTAACESLLRMGAVCDPAAIISLLQSENRDERFLARRLLALIPDSQWKNTFLTSASNRLAINSSLALISQAPTRENASLVLDSMARVSKGFVSDSDFVELLRVLQVTMHLVNVDGNSLNQWRTLVEREFPAGNATINAELIRLATYLQCDLVPTAIKYLQSDVSLPERMLIAMHLPMMNHSWSSSERMSVLQFLEAAQKVRGGGSYHLYVMKTSNAISEFLTEEESMKILALGEQYPNAALAALLKVPTPMDEDGIETLIKLDSQIDQGGLEEDVYKRLKTGITAILSQQENEKAIDYLRQRWRKSPDRRATIALALAQRPSEANWDYLVRSIPVLDTFAVPDVCNALRQIDVATEDADAIRQTIIQGCKLVEAGQNPRPVIDLLQYWTGETLPAPRDAKANPLAAWQKWFEVRFPDSPPAILPHEQERPRWSSDFLDQFLSGEQGKYGSKANGANLFVKAQCASCHKMNSQGNGFGPDLTSVAKRFTRAEFLESTLYPSHVISDQYAAKKVLTTSGQVYTGIVVKTAKGIVVRPNQEKEIPIAEDEIEEIMPSKVSAMPSGLLDTLTPSEIRDLLCYFGYIPQENLAEEKSNALRR